MLEACRGLAGLRCGDHAQNNLQRYKDVRHHQLLLAKMLKATKPDQTMFIGFIEGLYNKWPRIDKKS